MLKNTSANQTVRLVSGKFQYIDARGQVIKLEDARTEPALKFGGSAERRDPGQETTESVPSPYREEALNFAVRIGDAT